MRWCFWYSFVHIYFCVSCRMVLLYITAVNAPNIGQLGIGLSRAGLRCTLDGYFWSICCITFADFDSWIFFCIVLFSFPVGYFLCITFADFSGWISLFSALQLFSFKNNYFFVFVFPNVATDLSTVVYIVLCDREWVNLCERCKASDSLLLDFPKKLSSVSVGFPSGVHSVFSVIFINASFRGRYRYTSPTIMSYILFYLTILCCLPG